MSKYILKQIRLANNQAFTMNRPFIPYIREVDTLGAYAITAVPGWGFKDDKGNYIAVNPYFHRLVHYGRAQGNWQDVDISLCEMAPGTYVLENGIGQSQWFTYLEKL